MQRLSSVLLRSLERTCAEAHAHAKTTPPLTAWKNQWLTKDARGNLVLKARQQQPRLHALVTIYQRYQAALQAAELYDFDDMIGQVIHAASTSCKKPTSTSWWMSSRIPTSRKCAF